MNSNNSSKTGSLGEETASLYLLEQGYMLIFRNYRTKFGEIDIVARDAIGTLVLIEVKARKNGLASFNGFLPEDSLSRSKIFRFRRISTFFVNVFPGLVYEAGWQMDLVAIMFTKGRALVRHYRNI